MCSSSSQAQGGSALSGQLDGPTWLTLFMITLLDLGAVFWVGAHLWQLFVLPAATEDHQELNAINRQVQHRFPIEKNAHRQFAFFFVELEEKPFEPAIKIPIEITEIIPGRVIAVIGKLDRLAAGFAAPFAFGGAFRAALREQLNLLKPPQQFRCE